MGHATFAGADMFILTIASAALITTGAPQKSSRITQGGIAVSRLTPMTERDVTKIANGCLDERPYPLDAGPLCFFPDGRSRRYSGWGNFDGRYKVVKNRIVITNHNYADDTDLKPYSLLFYRDRTGRPYYRYDRGGLSPVAFPLRLAKS